MGAVPTREPADAALLIRRAVILVTPLALVGLLVAHGDISDTGRDWYLTLHLIRLPLFGLVALAAWWLLRGLRGWIVSLAGTEGTSVFGAIDALDRQGRSRRA